MKTYRLCLGQQIGYQHPAPERTAKRSVGRFADFLDDEFKVWPSREALARTVRMQEKRASKPNDWRPLIPLKDGEGY